MENRGRGSTPMSGALLTARQCLGPGRPARASLQPSFTGSFLRPARSHREHGFHGCVIVIAKPRKRTNFQNVQLPLRGDYIVADMDADHTANDDVVYLVKYISRQSQG